MEGGTARLTLATRRSREQVTVHGWMLKVDDGDRRPYERPRVYLDADVLEDRLPYGTHLLAADLPRLPGPLHLPAPVSVSGDPYWGGGRWRLELTWQYRPFGPERTGHNPSCVYCVHGPDCGSCPPPPLETSSLTVCTPCGRDVHTAELHTQQRAEEYLGSLC